MANNYYNFGTPFVPGTKVRSEQVNTEYGGVESGFDLLPTDPAAMSTGTGWFGTDVQGATVNEYLITTPDPQSALINGQRVAFFATHTNDGAVTFNVDGLGVVSAVDNDGAALAASAIITGQYYEFVYDDANTQWTRSLASSQSVPAGADTHVQFNDAGAFGGDAAFAWDNTGKELTITGKQKLTDNANPVYLQFEDTGEAVNERLWEIRLDGAEFFIQSSDDAGSSVAEILKATRSTGELLSEVILASTEVDQVEINAEPTAGQITFQSMERVRINADTPRFFFEEGSAGPDRQQWSFEADGEEFLGRIWDDATINSYDWLEITRSGTGAGVQVDEVSLIANDGIYLGNFGFDPNQAVGPGQDNFVLTYDNGTGLISLEAAPSAMGAFTLDGNENLFAGTGAGASLGGFANDNFFAGNLAGNALTTGDRNVAIGLTALTNAVGASDQVAIGTRALDAHNQGSGNANVAIGTDALGAYNDNAGFNVAIGPVAMFENTGGQDNVAIGRAAMSNSGAVSMSNNVAVGSFALQDNQGDRNIGIGTAALGEVVTGVDNVGIGDNALHDVFGSRNVAIGTEAGDRVGIGNDNTFVGHNAGVNLLTGSDRNIAIGKDAGPTSTGADDDTIWIGPGANPFIGGDLATGGMTIAGTVRFTERADHIQTPAATFGELWVRNDSPNVLVFTDDTGVDTVLGAGGGGGAFTLDAQENLFAGTGAGAALIGTSDNNFLAGPAAGASITGDNNIAIGNNAGGAITTGIQHIAIGNQALGNVGGAVTGGTNIAIGSFSMDSANLTTANTNIAIGSSTMSRADTSNNNIAIGNSAGRNITDSTDNIAIGRLAMGENVALMTGDNNIAIGPLAMRGALTTAADNVMIGYDSGGSLTEGFGNTAVGRDTLPSLTTGDQNVAIGDNAGASITLGSTNILIGQSAGPTVNTSNELYIDVSQRDDPFLGGSFATGNVTLRGTIRFTERADHILTFPTATFGELWVRDDTPNVLVFTDDAGNDTVLGAGGGGGIGGSIATEQIAFGATTANDIEGSADLTWDVSQERFTIAGSGNGDNFRIRSDFPEILLEDSSSTNNARVFGNFDDTTAFNDRALEFSLNGSTKQRIKNDGIEFDEALFIEERAAADTDRANYGQIWVKDDTPNNLYFTDDAGTDFLLNGAGGGNVSNTGTPVDNQVARWTAANVIEGTSDLRFLPPAGNLRMEGTQPGTLIVETGGGLDQKVFTRDINGGVGFRRIQTDDFITGAYTYEQVTRSGTGASIQVDTIDWTSETDITQNSPEHIFNDGTLFIEEIAAAQADKANYGQLWVKNTTPNELWFTDDAGTDFQLGVGGSPGGANTNVQYNSAGSFAGNANFTTGGTGGIILSNSPQIVMFETATAFPDQGRWNINTGSAGMSMQFVDDVGANPYNFLVVTRSGSGAGIVADDMTFQAGDFLFDTGSIFIEERASAQADKTGYGQLWVNSADDSLNYTDEAGVNTDLTAGGGGVTASGTPVDNGIAVFDSASSIGSDTAFTYTNTPGNPSLSGQLKLDGANAQLSIVNSTAVLQSVVVRNDRTDARVMRLFKNVANSDVALLEIDNENVTGSDRDSIGLKITNPQGEGIELVDGGILMQEMTPSNSPFQDNYGIIWCRAPDAVGGNDGFNQPVWRDGNGNDIVMLGIKLEEEPTTSGTASKLFTNRHGLKNKQLVLAFHEVSNDAIADIRIRIGDSSGLDTVGYTGRSTRTALATGTITTNTFTDGWHIELQSAASTLIGTLTLSLITTNSDAGPDEWIIEGTILEENGASSFIHQIQGQRGLTGGRLDRVDVDNVSGNWDGGQITGHWKT